MKRTKLDRNGVCPECGRDYYDKDSTPTYCTADDCPNGESSTCAMCNGTVDDVTGGCGCMPASEG